MPKSSAPSNPTSNPLSSKPLTSKPLTSKPLSKPPVARITAAPPAPRTGASFRKRYDELERHREALINRLAALDKSHVLPARKQALKLLNETYRKSSLAQRFGVLQAASWMLDVIERLATTL